MRAWTGAGESADPSVSTPNAVPRLRPATAVQKEAREIPLPSPVPRAVNNLVASRAAVEIAEASRTSDLRPGASRAIPSEQELADEFKSEVAHLAFSHLERLVASRVAEKRKVLQVEYADKKNQLEHLYDQKRRALDRQQDVLNQQWTRFQEKQSQSRQGAQLRAPARPVTAQPARSEPVSQFRSDRAPSRMTVVRG